MKVVKESTSPRGKQLRQHKKEREDTQEFRFDDIKSTDVSMDTLWNELQGYIHGRSLEEQQQFVHDSQERIGQVLHQVRRVVDFWPCTCILLLYMSTCPCLDSVAGSIVCQLVV